MVISRSGLRRLTWRAGRCLYASARGEQRSGDIATNGEAYVQARVIAAVAPAESLQVLDIGANEGAWTLSLLRQLPRERKESSLVRIDAFEPVPATAERLRSALGGDAGVRVHGVALSDEPGSADMAIVSTTGGKNSLHFDAAAETPPGGWLTVEVSTVGAFCEREGIGRVQLAKVDAEGHDVSVLTGARGLFEQGRIDVFQFEYNYQWVHGRRFLKDVFDLIAGLPYRVARVDPACVEIHEHWHPELERFFHSNYVVIREPAIAWFDARRGRFDDSNTYA